MVESFFETMFISYFSLSWEYATLDSFCAILGSIIIFSNLLYKLWLDSISASSPFSPSVMISAGPPQCVATIGLECSIASRRMIPNGSLIEGRQKISICLKNSVCTKLYSEPNVNVIFANNEKVKLDYS